MPRRRWDDNPRLRDWLYHPPGMVGFRGLALLTLSLIWVMLGLAALTEELPTDYVYLHQQIPQEVRACLWIGTALVAAVHAFDPPLKNDALGFMALVIMPTERAFSYLWGWVVFLAPGGQVGAERGWVGAIIFAALVNLILLCSRWREPLPIHGYYRDGEDWREK